MAEFNMYNLYSMGGTYGNISKDDEVDACVKKLITMDEYSDVKDYVAEHFGNVDGEKLFEYPKIDKQINVLIDEEKIEICAAKNYKQFWGKGWYLVNKD